jgi:hypothetical protein
MFQEERAIAHQAIATLTPIADPRQAVKVLGYTPKALTISKRAQDHVKNVEEALKIIGYDEDADRFPAPGIRARAGAQMKIISADKFAKSIGR